MGQAGRVPRIVAGWAGSLPLAVPPTGTRPTGERAREALFSMLAARGAVEGAAVLDLYAGSGALGLEALSRGAASAVFVEQSPRAARVLRDNLARLRRAAPGPVAAEVVQRSVATHLPTAAGADLVLSDPPYDLSEADVARDLAGVARVLAPGGLAVLERAARSPAPPAPPGLEAAGSRRWGDTAVHLFAAPGAADD